MCDWRAFYICKVKLETVNHHSLLHSKFAHLVSLNIGRGNANNLKSLADEMQKKN